MKPDEVGLLFIRAGRVYIMESYCEQPTATFRDLQSGDKVGGAVGCPDLEGFKPLCTVDTPGDGSLIVTHESLGGQS